MGCSEKPLWNKATREELLKLKIEKPDEAVRKQVLKNWDAVAKPIDSMGRFEELTARIGAITGTARIDISRKAVIIMCADNGIVEEGVSQSGQEVTAIVAGEMGKGQSSVGKMAELAGADTIPVDIGINREEPIPGVLDRKVRRGTRNFRKEPAMTEEEALRAVFTGMDMVLDCKKAGYGILALGEMGIGNTTTSSAVAAALLGCEVSAVTGRGAGLSDSGLMKKQTIIAEAMEKYELKKADPWKILTTVGGLDIGGLAGVCIGGALFHVPVVLDGVISMAAAFLAEQLVPGTKDYLLPSHRGKEPAVEKLLEKLSLEPVIDGRLALGEGTGAVMMFSLLEMALKLYEDRTTFSDIHLEPYQRY